MWVEFAVGELDVEDRVLTCGICFLATMSFLLSGLDKCLTLFRLGVVGCFPGLFLSSEVPVFRLLSDLNSSMSFFLDRKTRFGVSWSSRA